MSEETPQVEPTEQVAEPQEVVEQAPEEVAEQPDWSKDDESDARAFGWKPPAEWKGEKPDGYIDNPTEYIERVQRSKIFQVMSSKAEAAEQAATESLRKLEAMSTAAVKRQQAEYEAKLQDLSAQQRKAAIDGDMDAFDRAEKARAGLTPPVEEAPQQAQPQADPAVVAYQQSNDWAKDPVLWQEAASAVNFMPNLQASTTQQQLDYAEKHMKLKYPHLFQKQEAPKPRQRVEAGGLAPSGGSGKSAFDALPAEAKAQFASFAKQGIFTDSKEDKEAYANDYNAA